MYKIFMLIAVPALIIGWAVYWWWNKKMEEEEKSRPKPQSERLTKTKKELSDWAQKIKNSESPAEQARKRREARLKELEEKYPDEERKNQQ